MLHFSGVQLQGAEVKADEPNRKEEELAGDSSLESALLSAGDRPWDSPASG